MQKALLHERADNRFREKAFYQSESYFLFRCYHPQRSHIRILCCHLCPHFPGKESLWYQWNQGCTNCCVSSLPHFVRAAMKCMIPPPFKKQKGYIKMHPFTLTPCDTKSAKMCSQYMVGSETVAITSVITSMGLL